MSVIGSCKATCRVLPEMCYFQFFVDLHAIGLCRAGYM